MQGARLSPRAGGELLVMALCNTGDTLTRRQRRLGSLESSIHCASHSTKNSCQERASFHPFCCTNLMQLFVAYCPLPASLIPFVSWSLSPRHVSSSAFIKHFLTFLFKPSAKIPQSACFSLFAAALSHCIYFLLSDDLANLHPARRTRLGLTVLPLMQVV